MEEAINACVDEQVDAYVDKLVHAYSDKQVHAQADKQVHVQADKQIHVRIDEQSHACRDEEIDAWTKKLRFTRLLKTKGEWLGGKKAIRRDIRRAPTPSRMTVKLTDTMKAAVAVAASFTSRLWLAEWSEKPRQFVPTSLKLPDGGAEGGWGGMGDEGRRWVMGSDGV